jgi:single-strand DNA-binding protein
MASYNKVILVGNLTRDPELRYTPSGTAVANLRLAVNRKFRDKAQQLKDETCFITAVVWSKQAETCNQYLHKGSSLLVEGRLQSRTWEDAQTGKSRSVIEVLAERVQFLGGAPGRSAAPAAQEQSSAQEPASVADAAGDTEWIEESEEKHDENQ